jgi:hypothetical protein
MVSRVSTTSVRREQQLQLFKAALPEIEHRPGLINQALGVDFAPKAEIVVRRYALP